MAHMAWRILWTSMNIFGCWVCEWVFRTSFDTNQVEVQEKYVDVPTTLYQEKVVEVPRVQVAEVVKQVPKIDPWTVVWCCFEATYCSNLFKSMFGFSKQSLVILDPICFPVVVRLLLIHFVLLYFDRITAHETRLSDCRSPKRAPN